MHETSGIDLVFYGIEGRLEFIWVAATGGSERNAGQVAFSERARTGEIGTPRVDGHAAIRRA